MFLTSYQKYTLVTKFTLVGVKLFNCIEIATKTPRNPVSHCSSGDLLDVSVIFELS